jgi:hypothetical protein
MNEQMKTAWLEISRMLGEPTREELDVFLRTWQRAIKAEREECAKVCDQLFADSDCNAGRIWTGGCAAAIRKRGQA